MPLYIYNIYNFCQHSGTKGACKIYIIILSPRAYEPRKIVFYIRAHSVRPLSPQIVTRENNENFGGSFPRRRLHSARSITHSRSHSPTHVPIQTHVRISSRSVPPSLGLWLIDLPKARNPPEFHHNKTRLFLCVNSYEAVGYSETQRVVPTLYNTRLYDQSHV